MNNKGLMGELIGEVFGTFILILLGVGVVANVGLAPRTAPGSYNWNTIAIGWAFAVIIAVYVSGGVSGAHLNPAVTLALAVKRGFAWAKVGPFWAAQVIGAFLGAAVVFLCYRDGMVAAGFPNIYTTGPGSVFGQAFWGGGSAAAVAPYSLVTCTITEIVATAVLLWGILASGDSKNMGLSNNLGVFVVGFTVLAIGLSLSGPSGYSLNPARDFGPRIFGLISGTQGLFNGIYWLVAPVIGPLIGGVVGIYVYDALVTANLPKK